MLDLVLVSRLDQCYDMLGWADLSVEIFIHLLMNCSCWNVSIQRKSFSEPSNGFYADIDRSHKKIEVNTIIWCIKKKEEPQAYIYENLPSSFSGIRYVGVRLVLEG